jgi:hypothetical protein
MIRYECTLHQPSSPGCKGENYGETADLSFLVGKKITLAGIGGPGVSRKLLLQYEDEQSKEHQVVMNFNELGIWIESHTSCDGPAVPTALVKRMSDFFRNSPFSNEEIWEKAVVEADPLKLEFYFSTAEGERVLTLSVSEAKFMGERVIELIRTVEGRKNVHDLLSEMDAWSWGAELAMRGA